MLFDLDMSQSIPHAEKKTEWAINLDEKSNWKDNVETWYALGFDFLYGFSEAQIL